MGIHSQVESAISRVHESVGRGVVVTNYEYDDTGGDNPYADGDWAETADSPTTVTTRVEFSDADADQSGETGSGADVESDATLYIPHDSVPIHRGTADESRATEFRDTMSGVTYRAVDVKHQDDVLAVDVEEF